MNSSDEIRVRLTLHYDGSGYLGWQVQPDVPTVQGELERAVERLTGSHRTVLGSGRTDRGVHAVGQVATLLVPKRWSADQFRKALNSQLPHDIWVAAASEVAGDFHPRYDAIARSYAYQLGVSDGAHSPFQRPYCWPCPTTVEGTLLTRAANCLVGRHSFQGFAKSGQPERGDRCSIRRAVWLPWGVLGYRFEITADRYLHHMVRYLVGTMVAIAGGKRPLSDLPRMLSGDATLVTSPPAPPEGLFLVRVRYPGEPEEERSSMDSGFPRIA